MQISVQRVVKFRMHLYWLQKDQQDIHTSQKSAPTNRFKFDVLLCEQSEGMKQNLYKKFPLYLTDRESLNIM